MASHLPSAGVKPGAYTISSGNAQLVSGEPGQPVLLSAGSAAFPWFIVPDDKPGLGATPKFILISPKETFLAKVVDVDLISTVADRARALSFEIMPSADGEGHKLVADGLVLARVETGGKGTFDSDGKVELRAPDVSEDETTQLWQLKPVQGGAFTQFDTLL
ncbi:hypothetical protein AURDEDRAFT_167948 [Auricularia subglabra TFB-10046 SS5]|nr:hypothetical protein AURDEDRAFT_167948 [Auricularia subglabra TFB-10046 SS5]